MIKKAYWQKNINGLYDAVSLYDGSIVKSDVNRSEITSKFIEYEHDEAKARDEKKRSNQKATRSGCKNHIQQNLF